MLEKKIERIWEMEEGSIEEKPATMPLPNYWLVYVNY